MKIYADVLFLINFISTYILVDLTARITHQIPTLKRRVLSALAGALIAVISFCTGEYSGLFKLVSILAVTVIAFSLRGFDTLRQMVVFAVISLVMSAVFAVINSFNGSQTVVMRNGIMYFNIPIMQFIIIFAAAYFAISISLWFIKRRKYANRHDLVITLKDKSVCITALVDSGNVLKEPVTGKDVIIAEWDKIRSLFGNVEYKELKRETDKYKLWLVPYHSLGNTGGLIYAFLADDIHIADEKRCIGKIFIGITNEKLSAKDEYNALMGASL